MFGKASEDLKAMFQDEKELEKAILSWLHLKNNVVKNVEICLADGIQEVMEKFTNVHSLIGAMFDLASEDLQHVIPDEKAFDLASKDLQHMFPNEKELRKAILAWVHLNNSSENIKGYLESSDGIQEALKKFTKKIQDVITKNDALFLFSKDLLDENNWNMSDATMAYGSLKTEEKERSSGDWAIE